MLLTNGFFDRTKWENLANCFEPLLHKNSAKCFSFPFSSFTSLSLNSCYIHDTSTRQEDVLIEIIKIFSYADQALL